MKIILAISLSLTQVNPRLLKRFEGIVGLPRRIPESIRSTRIHPIHLILPASTLRSWEETSRELLCYQIAIPPDSDPILITQCGYPRYILWKEK